MTYKLLTLSIFELKRKIFHEVSWLSNALLIFINISIFPLTINPTAETLKLLFLSVIVTSMLLGIILITSNSFTEDLKDGTLDQYISFGIKIPTIFLSKIIASSIEFILIITLIIPCAAILYSIPLFTICKIWITLTCSIPLLTSISIFGSLLTINLTGNISISILITFPLLISSLILLSLDAREILEFSSSSNIYLETLLGFELIILPIFCWLTKIMYK